MRTTLSALLATALLGALAPVSRAQVARVGDREEALTELELLHARPFVLDEPYVHTWRKETPAVRSGYVLVLRGPLERIARRQAHEPVLFVGAQTAERINSPPLGSGETGQLVVLVPAPLDLDGDVALDPWSAPTFLGSTVLPEDVDAERIELELDRARRLQLGPPRRPRGADGEPLPLPPPAPALRLPDRHALGLELASLIEFYSPLETDLVAGLRVPVHR